MWPFRRKRAPRPTTEARQAIIESIQADQSTQQGLAEEIGRWPRVNKVTESFQDVHRRNHFSEAMDKLMRGI